MGGKNYYCDFCECFIKNDINVRKKHNEGLSHTIARKSYYRRFESPSKILAEERVKVPCTRYWKGYCKFNLFCQYSHFSEKQLAKLHKIVNSLKRQKKRKRNRKRKHKPPQDPIPLPAALPWQMINLPNVAHHKLLKKKLPPSLRPIDFRRLDRCNEINNWG